MPSFTAKVREELSKVQIKNDACALSELAGILHSCAGGLALRVVTENKNTVNLLFSLVRKLYQIDCELTQTVNQLKKEIYQIDIRPSDTESFFNDLAIPYGIAFDVNTDSESYISLTDDNDKKICYLRGMMLGNGIVTDPRKQYHLQIEVTSSNVAEAVRSLMQGSGINAKTTKRKDSFCIYIKEAQSISDLLTVLGAHSCVLEMEEIRLTRELRNTANRQVNFENANIDKTVASAMVQIQAIRLIDEKIGLDSLSPALKEAAELRLEYPEAPLSELSEISGNVSRSGMNNRLRKIMNIAERYR